MEYNIDDKLKYELLKYITVARLRHTALALTVHITE